LRIASARGIFYLGFDGVVQGVLALFLWTGHSNFYHRFHLDTMPDQISVLFVCLGNICRSTLAEGVFQSLARKAPYEDLVATIDSCGTGAFLGNGSLSP
jgi:hypothetical protein